MANTTQRGAFEVDQWTIAALSRTCIESASEVLYTGDDSTTSYSGTLPSPMRGFKPGSLAISAIYDVSKGDAEAFTETSYESQIATLTGDRGSTATVNLESGAWTVTHDVGSIADGIVTFTGEYLAIDARDYCEVTDLEVKRVGAPIKTFLNAGTQAGALPSRGQYHLSFSGKAPMYFLGSWHQIKTDSPVTVGPVPASGDTVTLDLYKLKRIAGIHKRGLASVAKGVGAAAVRFTITAWGETFQDEGDGTLTSAGGGTGTINYSTGVITLLLAGANPAGDATITQCVWVPVPTVYDMASSNYAFEFVQEEIDGTWKAQWRAVRATCGGTRFAVRCQQNANDCSSSVEYRGDEAACTVSFSAEGDDQLFMEFTGKARGNGPRFDLAYSILGGEAPYIDAASHIFVDGSLLARPDLANAGSNVEYKGAHVGAWKLTQPFSDPERIGTAWGESSTAEIKHALPRDANTMAELVIYDLKSSQFDVDQYIEDLVVHELVQTWNSQRVSTRTITHELVGYLEEYDNGDVAGNVTRNLKLCGVHGLPGTATPGRKLTDPVGRWIWSIDHDDPEDVVVITA